MTSEPLNHVQRRDVQVTAILFTAAVDTVPDAAVSEQRSPDGCAAIETLYAAPVPSWVGKVNDVPPASISRTSEPFASVSPVAVNPSIRPPIV